MTTFAAIDPGMSTGASLWYYTPHGPLPAELLATTQFTGGLHGFLHWWDENDWPIQHLVVERYKLDARAHKTEHIEPVRIEGAIETLWGTEEVDWQTNQALAHVTTNNAKQAGYWVTPTQLGQPDNNDAVSSIKHGLYWLKQNHRPTLEHVWGTP